MAQVIISQLPPLPNGTGSGSPKGTDLTPATDTTDTTEAASGTTKKYTRAAEFNFYMTAQGFTTLLACLVATTTAFTVTYANGAAGVGATLTNAGAQSALSIDGVTLAVGNRVLVKNQASTFQNGIYTVTNIGSGATNWVMTRATDYDQAAEIAEDQVVLINKGTISAGLAYQQTSPGPFVMGTSPITFTLMNQGGGANFSWFTVTGTSQTMTSNNGYTANNGSLVTFALPASSAVGSLLEIAGLGAGGWLISQAAGQQIHVGVTASTLGATGSVASSNQYDTIRLRCIVVDTIWTCVGAPESAGLTVL
jgi:hypothetical protein